MQDQTEPLTVSIRADGSIFLQETAGRRSPTWRRALQAMAGDGYDKPIYVRADGKAPYAIVAQVMAALSTSGFTTINLITDTGGPSSGGKPLERRARRHGAAHAVNRREISPALMGSVAAARCRRRCRC